MTKKYPHGPGFVAGSDTSEAAARKVDAATKRAVVHRALLAALPGGLMDDDLERILGMPHQTASARRRELELMGLCWRTHERRMTRSGHTAGVYKAGVAPSKGAAPSPRAPKRKKVDFPLHAIEAACRAYRDAGGGAGYDDFSPPAQKKLRARMRAALAAFEQARGNECASSETPGSTPPDGGG